MFERLFPAVADNRFRGSRVALWLFGLTLTLKIVIGARSMVDTAAVAQGADGIPLDRFPAGAAQEILSVFALLGLMHVVMGLTCLIVLARYRALVPLMFALLLVERLMRSVLLALHPGAPTQPGAPGQIVAATLVGFMVLGFALCFWPNRTTPPTAGTPVPPDRR